MAATARRAAANLLAAAFAITSLIAGTALLASPALAATELVWNGAAWEAQTRPGGSAAVDVGSSETDSLRLAVLGRAELKPVRLEPIDSDLNSQYYQWEATAARLAQDDIVRRLAQQDPAAHRVDVLADYAAWEAARAADAEVALDHRLKLTNQTAQTVRSASERADQATQQLVGASDADPNAQAEAEAAAQQQAAAEAEHQRAQQMTERARAQALTEAQNAQQLNQAALAARAAQAGGSSAAPIEGSGDQAVNEPTATEPEAPAPPAAVETPAPEPPPAEPPSPYAWQTYVANVDAQAAIDACAGGLTYSPDLADILGRAYYAMHNYCGGMAILSLNNGDVIYIQGVGQFQVVGSRDVKKGDTTSVIMDLPGQVLMQTCYPDSDKMRVVALDPIAS